MTSVPARQTESRPQVGTIAWVGIDVGAKRSGVATSTSGSLATGWGLLKGSLSEQARHLGQLLAAWHTTTLIIGQPSRLQNGHPTIHFVALMRKYLDDHHLTTQIALVNEDASTKEAERLGHGRQSDIVAAQLILEAYFAMERVDHAE